MRCSVRLTREGQEVVASCAEFPECHGRAPSAGEAMARLRDSVLFWLEACPCDTTAGGALKMDVVEDRTRA